MFGTIKYVLFCSYELKSRYKASSYSSSITASSIQNRQMASINGDAALSVGEDFVHVLQFPLQLSVFLLQCFYRLGQRVDEFRNFRSSICSFLICCGHEFSSGNGFIIIRKYPEDRRHFSSRHFPQYGPVQQYPPDTVRRRPVAPACRTKCGGSTRAGGTR